MDELETNATAQDVKDQNLMLYRMELLFLQYRRHLVTDLLNQASNAGSLITDSIPGQKEKYSDLLDHLNNEIIKTVKLITDDEENIPDKTEQDIAPEAPVIPIITGVLLFLLIIKGVSVVWAFPIRRYIQFPFCIATLNPASRCILVTRLLYLRHIRVKRSHKGAFGVGELGP